MKETMKVGLEHVRTYRVPENKTVPRLCPEAMAPHMEPVGVVREVLGDRPALP